MAQEFCILHHRQHGPTGGHWDIVENPIPYRASTATAPHGEGSLCAGLQHLAEDGWGPLMTIGQMQSQSGETFILLGREARL